MNTAISYNQLQANLDKTCNQVCSNHEAVLVHRQNGNNVVLVSQDDYSSLLETAYLLNSSENAKRLLESLNNREKDITFESVDELKTQLNFI